MRDAFPGASRRLSMIAIAVGGVLLFPLPSVGEDNPRGIPGSVERTNWCATQLAHCVTNGQAGCLRTYAEAAARSTCFQGVYQACTRSFGEQSNCETIQRATVNRAPERPTTNERGSESTASPSRTTRRPTRTDRNANGIPDAQERGMR